MGECEETGQRAVSTFRGYPADRLLALRCPGSSNPRPPTLWPLCPRFSISSHPPNFACAAAATAASVARQIYSTNPPRFGTYNHQSYTMARGQKTERKQKSALYEQVTREYTINLHKRTKSLGWKHRAPTAIKEIRKFAEKTMGTKDVRIDPTLNGATWQLGIKSVPRRVRVRLSRKRNDDENAKEKLYVVASYVPGVSNFKGLQTQVVETEEEFILLLLLLSRRVLTPLLHYGSATPLSFSLFSCIRPPVSRRLFERDCCRCSRRNEKARGRGFPWLITKKKKKKRGGGFPVLKKKKKKKKKKK